MHLETQMGLLTADQERKLTLTAGEDNARRVLFSTTELREALAAILYSRIDGVKVAALPLEILERVGRVPLLARGACEGVTRAGLAVLATELRQRRDLRRSLQFLAGGGDRLVADPGHLPEVAVAQVRQRPQGGLKTALYVRLPYAEANLQVHLTRPTRPTQYVGPGLQTRATESIS